MGAFHAAVAGSQAGAVDESAGDAAGGERSLSSVIWAGGAPVSGRLQPGDGRSRRHRWTR